MVGVGRWFQKILDSDDASELFDAWLEHDFLDEISTAADNVKLSVVSEQLIGNTAFAVPDQYCCSEQLKTVVAVDLDICMKYNLAYTASVFSVSGKWLAVKTVSKYRRLCRVGR